MAHRKTVRLFHNPDTIPACQWFTIYRKLPSREKFQNRHWQSQWHTSTVSPCRNAPSFNFFSGVFHTPYRLITDC